MANIQVTTVGGGCFWCVEAVIQRVKGVIKIESGYSNGHVKNPTYREVCAGTTGHAEVAQIHFDSDIISLKDLLTIFMTSHDPTTLNRQGADRGTQYRSIIAYHNEDQKQIAETLLKELEASFDDPIVTEIVPLDHFYPAEAYHQDYYNKNSFAGYCRIVIDPKINKLKAQYADKMKEEYKD